MFLHENPWDRWSRGLSFAMRMSEGPDVRETQNVFSEERILFQVKIRVRR